MIIQILLAVAALMNTQTDPSTAPAAPPVAEATFKFAPPDGLRLVEKLKETSHDRTGNTEPLIETRELISDVVWQQTPDGCIMTVTLRRVAKYEVDSKPYADPKSRVLLNKPITYRLSKNGELLSIAGYEDGVLDGVKNHIPGDMQQQMMRESNPQKLKAQDQAEWRRRTHPFVGQTVRAGDKWELTDSPDAAIENVRLDSLTRFPEIHSEGERTLVTIDFQYSTVDSIRDASSPTRRGNIPVLKAKGQRVVDANTMMLVSEKITTVAAMRFSEYDDGTPINRVRTVTREYEYSLPEPQSP